MSYSKFILSVSLLLLLSGICEAKGKKKFYIADRKIACAGAYQCMQLKEKAKGPWHVYSDTIAGFNYEEGYKYTIKVQSLQTENTFAGLYDEKYKLVKIISKRKTDYLPPKKLDNKKWILKSMYDTKNTMKAKDNTAYVIFDIAAGKVSGMTTCNGFAGKVKTPGGHKIAISSLAPSKKLCADANKMSIERIILKFLAAAVSYQVEDNTLTIQDPSGDNLIFITE